MMISIFEATDLNNCGVYHLQSNEFRAALSSFRSAVRLAKEILPSIQASQSSQSVNPSEGTQMNFVDIACAERMLGEPFVCKSAITISIDPTTADSSDQIIPIVSTAAIYNLAIANHLCGLQYRSSSHLEQALKHYGLSYRILQRESSSYNPTHALCTLNNVAMIHRQMGNVDDSDSYLRQLLATMRIVDLTGGKIHRQYWAGFCSNVMWLVSELTASAAAA
eukprot:scaffold11242_cov106-Cylindrotheca_fusiformis.AAC.1